MSECQCLNCCIFYHDQMPHTPQMSQMYEVMKRKYCLGSSKNCARLRVFLAKGSECVPSSLYPHQLAEAEDLIRTKVAI